MRSGKATAPKLSQLPQTIHPFELTRGYDRIGAGADVDGPPGTRVRLIGLDRV